MKYKILTYSLIILAILSCERVKFGNEFLEKDPGVDVTQDTIFSNAVYANRFLTGAYATLPYGINIKNDSYNSLMSHGLLEGLTDLSQDFMTWSGPYVTYYTGQYNSSSETGGHCKYSWYSSDAKGWVGIRKAWILLENIDRVSDMSESDKKRIKAEAKMIMAVHYSDLFRHYGGVPFVDHAFSTEDDFGNLPRMTAQATCDWIVQLCDEAAADLPWTIADHSADDGRFTQASAMGLKARILLFNASPIFNDNEPYLEGEASSQLLTWHGGYDANKWKLAMDAAAALIMRAESTGDYGLHISSDYTTVFADAYKNITDARRKSFLEAYYMRGTKEQLISSRRYYQTATGWDYTFYWSSYGWGCTNPTFNYVQMFPMLNGLPVTDPSSGYDENNPFVGRDPRLYESVTVNGDGFKGRTAELYIGGRERKNEGGTQARSGFIVHKFMLDCNSSTSHGSITHWPYLRMAEIYLTYAEAANEFNGGPTAEAYRCINAVRSRVGMPDLPIGGGTMTQEEFREAVILERALEFYLEDVRWFDLIRWKREADFTKQLTGLNTRGTSVAGPFTYDVYLIPDRYWKTTSPFNPKWYFSALPVGEVNKGYGLIQNPGWE